MIEIRQLRYFVAVAEELHFHRAADRLHLSQPALSRQIQALEEAIPARLLERTSKQVWLTEAGKLFYLQARSMLDQLQQASDETRRIAAGQAGQVNVGIFGSAILDLVPRVLRRFSGLYPDVDVALHAMDKDAQIQALRERWLTVGFNRLVPDEPDIVQEKVRTEPLMLALHASHPLAGADLVDMVDLLDQPLVLYPKGVRNSLIQQVSGLFADYGAAPRVAKEVADAPTAIALVAAGIGLSVVPSAAMSLRLPGVVYRALRCRRPASIELVCLYRRGERHPILENFLAVVRSIEEWDQP